MVDITTTVFNDTVAKSYTASIGKDLPVTSINYTLTLPVDLKSNYENQTSNEIQINCSKGQTIMVRTFEFLLS